MFLIASYYAGQWTDDMTVTSL